MQQPLDFARQLRSQMTEAEKRLWYHLRARRLHGLKFRRQVPIGPYVVDFYCDDKQLVVEVDGGQHGDARRAHDETRDRWLRETHSVTVLRFWNNDVLRDTSQVLEEVLRVALQRPSGVPHP